MAFVWASLVELVVKNLPASTEDIRDVDLTLGQEDPMEEGMASNSSIFFFSFIFISWRLITLQYCSGFSHTLT